MHLLLSAVNNNEGKFGLFKKKYISHALWKVKKASH